ncbi:N-acetylmuramoyl-L-alanine amidase [Calothrix sp. PCC 6303]|uniref:N-acetylmuramoyl-L-alanine amidase n=1 Tax=Calothrix sp. PCC 6303 TaxID=1170562 RepID=UPI0002A017DB|nr:peptidoglycan recognition family protein [Calothrix sp. PCC 6303]AFZ02454.1 N-acetylmuramoyl-L-alanine amidase family 2 [Calothrix sp. PCC 6303]
MRDSVWITRLLIISLVVFTLIGLLFGSKDTVQPSQEPASNLISDIKSWNPSQVEVQQAEKNQPKPIITSQAKVTKTPAPTKTKLQNSPQPLFKTTSAFKNYTPQYVVMWADPSNYGERFATDINGVPVYNQPIIVLHETSNSAQSAVNTFTNNQNDETKQVSYHTLITLSGQVVYLVPPDKRAFGAGNSVFETANGLETVQTSRNFKPSVNNFAYHVSLETPPDAWNKNVSSHSGYTDAQYNSLAWLIAQSEVPDERITTHRSVDRSGQRIDPVSFDFDRFFSVLHSFRKANIPKG